MILTGLEQALLGFVILVVGGGGTKVVLNKVNGKKLNNMGTKFVPREICARQHDSLKELLDEKFNHVNSNLDDLKIKIDKLNGTNA